MLHGRVDGLDPFVCGAGTCQHVFTKDVDALIHRTRVLRGINFVPFRHEGGCFHQLLGEETDEDARGRTLAMFHALDGHTG